MGHLPRRARRHGRAEQFDPDPVGVDDESGPADARSPVGKSDVRGERVEAYTSPGANQCSDGPVHVVDEECQVIERRPRTVRSVPLAPRTKDAQLERPSRATRFELNELSEGGLLPKDLAEPERPIEADGARDVANAQPGIERLSILRHGATTGGRASTAQL